MTFCLSRAGIDDIDTDSLITCLDKRNAPPTQLLFPTFTSRAQMNSILAVVLAATFRHVSEL